MAEMTVDDIITSYTQGTFSSSVQKTAIADPVSIIEAAYKAYSIAKTLGLFGDSSIENAIGGIAAEINKIYREIEALHQRIDAVRNELINFVIEVEYRNIAAEVISLTKAIGALQSGQDSDFLAAAYLDTAPNEYKLLERLDENTVPTERAAIFVRYLDLFIMHANCRLAILLRAPALPLHLRVSEIRSLRDNLQKYCLIARDRLFDIYKAGYTIRICKRDGLEDDDGRDIGVTDTWGYTLDGEEGCTGVTRISLRSGSGQELIRRNRQLKDGARKKVEDEIRRLSRLRADEQWNRDYRTFTLLSEEP